MRIPFRGAALLALVVAASLSVTRPTFAADKEKSKPAGKRFLDRGGYVEDTTTGLLWQKDGKASGKMNWQKAQDLAKGVLVGKLKHWRVPTRAELAGIFPATEKPWRNTPYTPNRCCKGPEEFASYWTSELDTRLPDYAYCYQWYADGGPNNCYGSKNFCYVRPVHDPLEPRLSDVGDGANPADPPAADGEPKPAEGDEAQPPKDAE